MSETAPFTKQQPKDGELILHCPHMDGKVEFFMFPEYAHFRRPDGTEGRTRWLLQCPSCMVAMPEQGPTIAGDGIWKGDEPAIQDVRG